MLHVASWARACQAAEHAGPQEFTRQSVLEAMEEGLSSIFPSPTVNSSQSADVSRTQTTARRISFVLLGCVLCACFAARGMLRPRGSPRRFGDLQYCDVLRSFLLSRVQVQSRSHRPALGPRKRKLRCLSCIHRSKVEKVKKLKPWQGQESARTGFGYCDIL